MALAACDDENTGVEMMGGGPGSSMDNVPAGSANGAPITTMASEFGYVDDPAHGGTGDPGNGGGPDGWKTGSGGANIGRQTSTGVSLPASTETAWYGSTSAAMGQSVEVVNTDTGVSVISKIVDVGPGVSRQAAGYGLDVTYGTARTLGMRVNGSAHVQVIPLMSKQFSQ